MKTRIKAALVGGAILATWHFLDFFGPMNPFNYDEIHRVLKTLVG